MEESLSSVSDVKGLHGRRKLTKETDLNDATLAINNNVSPGKGQNWMDKQREHIQAYEYLCHIGEAKEWMEAILGKQLGETTTLEERLRNGIYLALLAKHFEPSVVKKIFEGEKLQFRHSDNIVFFLAALRKLGLPQVFYFETIDLYEKKNIPKVIYCIHALGFFLHKKGLAPPISNLVGKLDFTEAELSQKQADIDESGIQMPSFTDVANAVAEHMESEEEKRDRIWKDKRDLVVALQSIVRKTLCQTALQRKLKLLNEKKPQVILLQSKVRSFLQQRRKLRLRQYYEEKQEAITKIQSFLRMKNAKSAYRALLTNEQPSPQTLSHFVNLIDKDNVDFDDELEIQNLREAVFKKIRENSEKETEINELDIKIALLVKNRISIEDFVRSTSKTTKAVKDAQTVSSDEGTAILNSLKSLDKGNVEKRKRYEELFYLLQTQPTYLSRLFFYMNRNKVKTFFDSVVFSIFGYAQNSRDEYMLLKLIDATLMEEVSRISDFQELLKGNPIFVQLAVVYTRGPKEREYLKDLLGPLVKPIIESNENQILELHPLEIWHEIIKEEESKTGEKSILPYDIPWEEAAKSQKVQDVFNTRVATLKTLTENFLRGIEAGLETLPYGIRYVSSRMYQVLAEKFPSESKESITKVIGNLVYYRYMNPAIVAPEAFDVINSLISPEARKALAEISKIMHSITSMSQFKAKNEYLRPLNPWIEKCSQRFIEYLTKLIDVCGPEEKLGIDEFKDLIVTQKPQILISSFDIFHTHEILETYSMEFKLGAEDPLLHVLNCLGKCPKLSGDLKKNSPEVTLQLRNIIKSTEMGGDRGVAIGSDLSAMGHLLLIETKRLVLTLLRCIKNCKDMKDLLEKEITPAMEDAFQNTLIIDLSDPAASQDNVFKSNAELSDLTLEKVRNKVRQNLEALETTHNGIVAKSSGYQQILNMISRDIRQQNKRRIQRDSELASLRKTLKSLTEKGTYLDEQISSFNDYVQACVNQFANKTGGKKKHRGLPFSMQAAHIRDLQRQGKVPKFGSYKYTAETLYKKGVLVSVQGLSPKQYDKLTLTISSDEVGIFNIQVSLLGMAEIQSVELKLEDLLQAQFNNVQVMNIADAKINVNLMIFLINKKFYQS